MAITRKQFHSLRHDPRTVALIIVAPFLATVVFGFAFGTEIEHIPIVVVNHDAGGDAAAILANLNTTEVSVTNATDDTYARQLVLDGKAVAAITFPANFTAGLTPKPGSAGQAGTLGIGGTPGSPPQAPSGSNISVYVDESNSQESAVVAKALANATQKWAASLGQGSPIRIDSVAAYAANARYIDYFVPGIMGFFGLVLTTLLTLLAFVAERTNGTLDRLRVTPATEGEIVLGYVVTFGIVGAVQSIVLLATALLAFHILIVGNVLLAALIVVLLAVDAQAIGILLSAAARREAQAVQMFPLIIFPVFLLSGIFVPLASLPDWLRPLAYLLPPTWGIEALRDVMLRGWGLDRIGLHVAVLIAFAVVFTFLAVVSLKRARSA
jgi:ABC-2 type transport system permease protein